MCLLLVIFFSTIGSYICCSHMWFYYYYYYYYTRLAVYGISHMYVCVYVCVCLSAAIEDSEACTNPQLCHWLSVNFLMYFNFPSRKFLDIIYANRVEKKKCILSLLFPWQPFKIHLSANGSSSQRVKLCGKKEKIVYIPKTSLKHIFLLIN